MNNTTKTIAVINGPNLNLLGTRQPELYGSETLEQIVVRLKKLATELHCSIWDKQSNSEGELVSYIQQAAKDCSGIVINPGAYSHTSVAIRDALEFCQIPIIEVHLSNIFKREQFRHHSYISPVVKGVVCGLGAEGYLLALRALAA